MLFVIPSIFYFKGGWVGQRSHRLEVFEMGWSNVAIVLFLVVCGETFRAMDILLMAESYRLGVKRSTIVLPWEQPCLKPIFGKRQRLVDAHKFVPLPGEVDLHVTFDQKEVAGKVTWSRVTSVIPWPVAQERSLSRALENWRIIVSDDLEASVLGRQIRTSLDGTVTDMTVEQVIRDFCWKICFDVAVKSVFTHGLCKMEEGNERRCQDFSCYRGSGLQVCAGATSAECTEDQTY